MIDSKKNKHTNKQKKNKYAYRGYWRVFHGAASWKFGNGFARIFLSFGFDNSPSSNTDDHKKMKVLMMILIVALMLQKMFCINLDKSKAKFWFSVNCNGDNSSLFISGKEIYKFKIDNKTAKFPAQICLGSIQINLTMLSQKKYHLKKIFTIFQSNMMLLNN